MATVLVTGANRGIGLALCRLLAERGERVIATCRTPSSELEQLAGEGVEIASDIDVTAEDVGDKLRAALGEGGLDILINNAGVMTRESIDDFDAERIRREFEVNALAPMRVALALLDKLDAGAKVAFITSRMGSVADNTSGGAYGYRMSKAALNMAAVSLARDLSARHIAVALLHPGWVRTDMTGGSGQLDAEESARGLLARIDELTQERSGGFWHTNGDELPW
ncbi:SDR family oxidoreductase [Haliangium ochraceum]|uniref:Short-chain dehydrogenase/reductase SDR n=1 Tax=Haliangium ochraceum (strain DSM 14365 / JCM 11303 / SMP-2) TaxID=502025 RepID=D0LUJ4_HALO1|nr:SDR family oxidoreductase [Haliangium ochraceum]ACY19317.1 short-chain dehydrogenase/reductase SDR [Haliangium ochraceum DSM 14365]